MISQQDSQRVAAAIQAAEQQTSAEIVCVLTSSSSHLTAMPVVLAAIAALLTPWALMLLTHLPVQRMLSAQVLVFVVLMLLFGLPPVRAHLLPRKARRTIAYQAAMDQFVRRGLAEPRSGPAILIFVSLAERYARIIANDHVAARISDAEWREVLRGLLEELGNDRIAAGFVVAIDKSRVLLSAAFPPAAGAPQRFSDRLHVL